MVGTFSKKSLPPPKEILVGPPANQNKKTFEIN